MSRVFFNLRTYRILFLLGIFSCALLVIVRLRTNLSEADAIKSFIKDIDSFRLSAVGGDPPPKSENGLNDSNNNKTVIKEVLESETKKSISWISSAPVIIWIDLPNAFPWRHCLHEQNGVLVTTENCKATQFVVETLTSSDPSNNEVDVEKFLLKTSSGKCVVPVDKKVLKVKNNCDQNTDSYWIWTEFGQLQWTKHDCVECRKCMVAKKKGLELEMTFCEKYAEDQNFELGRWLDVNGTKKLTPVDVSLWQSRQDKMRDEVMNVERKVVTKALEEIDMDMALHAFDKTDDLRRRRAAVFYVDKGVNGISMVKWWIFTWRFIGLDAADQGFDLVMMTHPAAVDKLPSDCVPVGDNFQINFTSPGQCLYKPYLGVAYRDKTYDGYMNSQECLYGDGSEFLSQYTLLLRADLDTFPTPHMLNYWPKGIVVDIQYSTNHGLENIKQALRELACSVGIEHQDWFNMGSTWYGDGRSVRNLAKLTVALNKYGRAQMFGPGTACRCSTCDKLPKVCEWGSGPYAGTLLLYLQEIALNKILTQDNWDNMPKGQLDQGVTDYKRNVCEPVVIHCFHNGELFSKNAFTAGKYKKLDMAKLELTNSVLDMTNERDYATYMALVSNNQGINGQAARDKLKQSLGNQTWSQYCSSRI